MTDLERFEAFLRTYQDLVFATAVRLVGRAADAEDIAQTTFLKAWERFNELADNPSAAGWLKTVATNLALNHLSRYRSRWQFFSELSERNSTRDGASEIERRLAADDSPDEALLRSDDLARLERALRALPPHQRVPIVLFHLDRMSYEQIAARLAVSVGKIKTDIHRGRLALREALGTVHGPR